MGQGNVHHTWNHTVSHCVTLHSPLRLSPSSVKTKIELIMHLVVRSFLYVLLKSFILRFEIIQWCSNKKVALYNYLMPQYVKKEHFIFGKSPCAFLPILTQSSPVLTTYGAS